MHPLFPKAGRLTEWNIAAAIEAHRDPGPGLMESVYEGCPTREFKLRALKAVNQELVSIIYKSFMRGESLRFDVWVEDCVLIEAKSVARILLIHRAQLLSYMERLKVPIDLPFSFGESRPVDGISRLPLPGANL